MFLLTIHAVKAKRNGRLCKECRGTARWPPDVSRVADTLKMEPRRYGKDLIDLGREE